MNYVKNKLHEVFGDGLLVDIIISDIKLTINDINTITYLDTSIHSYSLELCVEYIIYLLMKKIKEYPKPEGKYIVSHTFPSYYDENNNEYNNAYDKTNYIDNIEFEVYDKVDILEYLGDEHKTFGMITNNELIKYVEYILS